MGLQSRSVKFLRLTPEEWQWRSGSGVVAGKAGGLAKLERKNFAICAREVSWYLLDFLVNFVNWSDF